MIKKNHVFVTVHRMLFIIQVKNIVIIENLCKTQRNTPPLEIPCDHFSSQPIRVFILSTISAQGYRGAEGIVKPWLAKMMRPG